MPYCGSGDQVVVRDAVEPASQVGEVEVLRGAVAAVGPHGEVGVHRGAIGVGRWRYLAGRPASRWPAVTDLDSGSSVPVSSTVRHTSMYELRWFDSLALALPRPRLLGTFTDDGWGCRSKRWHQRYEYPRRDPRL
jgi:hypothetical protein